MPSRKITEMTAATVAKPDDVFPIVQDGVNKKQTRGQFLTAESGDEISMASSDSARGIEASGRLIDLIDPTYGYYLWDGSAGYLEISPGSATYIFQYSDKPIVIQQQTWLATLTLTDQQTVVSFGNAYLSFGNTGIEMICDAGQSIAVTANDGSGMMFDVSISRLTFQGATGVEVRLGSDTDYWIFPSGGPVTLVLSGGLACAIPYQTPVSGDWNGTPPGIYEDALNRLAAWVASQIGPIP